MMSLASAGECSFKNKRLSQKGNLVGKGVLRTSPFFFTQININYYKITT